MKTPLRFLTIFIIIISSLQTATAQWTQLGLFGGKVLSTTTQGNKLIAEVENVGGGYNSSSFSTTIGANVNTWQPIGPRPNPNTTATFMVTSGSRLFQADGAGEIFESTDSGATWTFLTTILKPISMVSSDSVLLTCSGNGFIQRSVDGKTWSSTSFETGFYCMAVQPASPHNYIFAGSEVYGMYVSTDEGLTFSNIDNGLPQYNSVYALAVGQPGVIASSDSGIYISADHGASWSPVGFDTIAQTLAFDGTNILVGTDSGFYIGTYVNTAYVFTSVSLPCLDVTTLNVTGGYIFAGTFDGMYRSTDHGATWLQMDSGLYRPGVWNMQVNGSEIVAATFYGVSISEDSGKTFTHIDKNLSTMPEDGYNAIYKKGNMLLASARYGSTFRSTDGGQSWNEIMSNDLLRFFEFDNIIFAVCSPYYYTSKDNGATWARGNKPLYSLATIGNKLFGAGDYGFFVSTDTGATWTALGDTGLASFDNTKLKADGNTLYVMDQYFNLYHSTDQGANWSMLPPPNVEPQTVIYSANENQIVMGAEGLLYVTYNWGLTWQVIALPVDFEATSSLVSIGTQLYEATWSGLYVFNNLPAPGADTACAAHFTLYPDVITPHHWYALDWSSGTGPLSYFWNWGDSTAVSTGPRPSHTYSDSGYYNICLTITDTTGCTSSYCSSSTYIRSAESTMITVDVVDQLPVATGVPVIDGTGVVSIYPNPATTQLLIKTTNFKPQWLSIYDMDGRKVTGIPFTPQLDITPLAAGSYFVEIKGEENTVERKRFVKL